MKSMLKFIAAAVIGAAALTACGGHYKKPDAVVVAQPDYKLTDTVVGTGTQALVTTDDTKRQRASVIYTGYLYDASKADGKGAKVESSLDNTPITITFTLGLGQPIAGTAYLPGLDHAVLGTGISGGTPMRVGGTRTAILPASLAYGAAARGPIYESGSTTAVKYPAIPANSPLVYDIQLVALSDVATPAYQPPPSDLVIETLAAGTGEGAAAGTEVSLRYTLWVYDGMRPETGYKGVQADINVDPTKSTFNVVINGGSVITGFNEGITGIKLGEKRRLTVPPAKGYGSVVSGLIPANSTLIFEVERVAKFTAPTT